MEIYKALSEFQNEVPVIHKGTQGYGYSYADLPAIFEVINPLLKKYNLGFTQPIMGDTIKTIIFHTESGETIESLTEIPKGVTLKGMNDYQVLGSAITYLRRYALSSILGLVTDKDTDASGEQTKQAPKVEQKPKMHQLTADNVKSIIAKGTQQEVLDQIGKKYMATTIQIKELMDSIKK
jgi:hypothetical protein